MSNKIPLSQRIRPNSEAAPWVIEEVKKMEQQIEELEALLEQWSDYYVHGQHPDDTNILYTDTLQVLG